MRRAAAGGRRHDRREAEHPRVRVRRAHEQPALRPGAQPLESERTSAAARAAAAARPSPPASSTPRSAPTRPARSGSRPPSAGSRAMRPTWGLVPTDGVVPVGLDPRHGRPAGADRRGVRAAARDDGRPPARRPAGDGPPGRHRHEAVRARPTPRSPRSARRRSTSCRGARAGRAPAARRDRDDHAAGHAPGGGRPPTCPGSARGSPTTAPTSARGCSPACSCRRPPTSPACAPGAGRGRVRARARRLRPARRAGDADHRRRGWTRSRRTTAC